jgi:glycosyltransferase involved in cell wall biosynthesis
MISVVMPAYNCERFIGEAIESILTQTLKELELIVVDDGSTDGTRARIVGYARRDSRLRMLATGHGGPSQALNLGIEHARYPWLAVMHADDVSLPNRLATQLKAARELPRVIAWGAYAHHVNGSGRRLGLSSVGPITENEFQDMRMRGQVVHLIHPTVMMRKEAVDEVGRYDPAFDGSEDLELFDRLATLGPLLAVPEPLVLYRIHRSSVSMQRFLRMRVYTRYVRARHRARLAGEPLPSWNAFLRDYEAARIFTRLRRQADDLSQYSYRRAAVAYAEGRYLSSLAHYGVSTCLNPRYALRRAWNQKFSQEARR